MPSESAAVLTVSHLSKTYATGLSALKDVSFDIKRGEIFALLGPNGAGKTTLISIICGLVNASSGAVRVDGHHIVDDYRVTRSLIGLVPQELTGDTFESVWNAVRFSRGLFGLKPNPAHLEKVLRALSLWDKKDAKFLTLSGGMKRRVLIAKALAHEPKVLFLDEPTAGVDVELRRDMWRLVHDLREAGTTIILTTHYLEEAEEMADRIGVINKGELVLIEEKAALMRRMGQKQLTIELSAPLQAVPQALWPYDLALSANGEALTYTYMRADDEGPREERSIAELLALLAKEGIAFKDLHTEQSSLEDIFVSLVRR